MSRVHFRCVLIKVHNNSSANTREGGGGHLALGVRRRKSPGDAASGTLPRVQLPSTLLLSQPAPLFSFPLRRENLESAFFLVLNPRGGRGGGVELYRLPALAVKFLL
jgi:hypothetical protein